MRVSQRRQLHRSVAEWYERTHAGALAAHAPLLAHHWQAAAVPGKAIGYLDQASTQALRTGAYQEAVRGLSRMLQLDDRPRGPGKPEARRGSRSQARHRSPDAAA